MAHIISRNLPHEHKLQFLTDGGLETWLVFHRNIELRSFAAFELLGSREGQAILSEYFMPFLATAFEADMGFILDTPTWRASPDWGQALGYSDTALEELNLAAVDFLVGLRANRRNSEDILINGVIGPRGDGYDAGQIMTVAEAQEYHRFQADVFAHSKADMVSAITMTNVPEAIGIVRAAREADVPCVVSFTVETDGRLPSGQSLVDAITEVDDRTFEAPAYYMINCAHPDHFAKVLTPDAEWIDRVRGVRANASRLSHAELDEAETLDEGDPSELAALYKDLSGLIPRLSVLGGCCGTDHRHIHQICQAMRRAA